MKLRARRKGFWDMKDVELKGRNTGEGEVQGRQGLRIGCPQHISVQSYNMGCSFLFIAIIFSILITSKGVQVQSFY